MKNLLIGLTLLTSTITFASNCTVSIKKGKNFPEFVAEHVDFSVLVKEQEEALQDKGHTLVEGSEADKEIILNLVTEINGAEGYWTVHRADAYTLAEGGRVGDIDESSTHPWFGSSTNKGLIQSVISKAVDALPDC